MKYSLGNPAPAIFQAVESNDCVVRAFTNAVNMPYEQIHTLFKWMGRKTGHRTSGQLVFDALEILMIPRARPINRYMTLAKFLKVFPNGTYYVHSRKHAWCVKAGMVLDSWKVSGKARITSIGVVQSEVNL